MNDDDGPDDPDNWRDYAEDADTLRDQMMDAAGFPQF